MVPISRVTRAVHAAAFALVLALPAALAMGQQVSEILPGADTVTGEVSAPGQVDRVPFRLVDGAVLTVAVKAGKGSALLPQVTVLGVDLAPDGVVGAALITSKKGNAVVLKNHPVTGTGLRYLEVRGRDGSTGTWSLAMKVKLPKGFAGGGSIPSGAVHEVRFACPGNATTTIVAKAAKGAPAVPEFVSIVDPQGQALLVDDVAPGKTGFTVRNALLGKPGEYVLRVRAGAAADFTVTAKWKLPKPVKRGLLEGQIRVLPILTSISPVKGALNETPSFRVTGHFLQQGVVVRFLKPPTVVGVAGSAITVDDGGASFVQSLAPFQRGTYDVEAENPDGGLSTLPKALEILNAAAVPVSVTPKFGSDIEVVRVTLTGTFLNATAAVALERDGETIPGVIASGGGSLLQVDFDLVGRTLGFWDVVVTNPEAEAGRLPAAFEIRNPPPVPVAIAPADDLQTDTIDATITGSLFDVGATVLLRRAGQADIPASSTQFVSAGELRAALDVSGAAIGTWDVIVTNPDDQSGTLPAAFRRASVARAAQVLKTSGVFDAPPSVAMNTDAGEYAVAWLEAASSGPAYDVMIQRVDGDGAPVDDAVSLSSATAATEKRDVDVAWCQARGEYLVTWSEKRTVTIPSTTKHPSGTGLVSLFQVMAQVVSAKDLTLVGKNVSITDATQFPANSGWYLEAFDNIRPRSVWDAKRSLWQVVFTQRWDTSGLYSSDDFDVILRSFNPVNGNIGDLAGTSGGVTGIASSAYHEGDASIAWDPAAAEVVVAYGARAGSDTAPKDLHVGRGGPGAFAASAGGGDVAGARLIVDQDAGRILATWTKVPSSGARTVQGVALNRSTLAAVGSVTTLGSGADDHFSARPAAGVAVGEAMVAWTRLEGDGSLTVRVRRVDTDGNSGLAVLGTEAEVSGGSGNEGMPSCVVDGSGNYAIFWSKTLNLVTVKQPAPGYFPGMEVPSGGYTANEIWTARMK